MDQGNTVASANPPVGGRAQALDKELRQPENPVPAVQDSCWQTC